MSETKWTRGPWDKHEIIGIAGQDDAGISLGFINTNDDEYRRECKANARLIASAPELYEALAHCEELLMRYEINRVNGDEISDAALTKIRAAMAKARGEQP